MATESRRADTSVEDDLLKFRPFVFNFFQAVRLLKKIYPDRQSVGGEAFLGDEVVRFRGDHSLSFAPSSIKKVETKENGQTEMSVSFMGLTGRQGVLPFHYTELVLQAGDSVAHFFDLFLHRMVSFFFRSWEKNSLAAQFELEATGEGGGNEFSQYFFDLLGMGTDGLRSRLPGIDDRVLIYYSGLIAQRPHSASALETILSDYFQVRVKVEQFAGRWISLDESEYTDLAGPGLRNQLGEGATLGEAIWNPQAGVRLCVGPLNWQTKQFQAFLPTGDAFLKLVSLTRFFLDWHVHFDIQLVLQKTEVPDWILVDEGPYAPKLGLSTWLKTADFEADAADVILSSNEMTKSSLKLAAVYNP